MPPPAGATLRPEALDEIHRHVLLILEEMLGSRYRILREQAACRFHSPRQRAR
ncbi:MAG: hypothetical protein U5O39_13460 [Gammaproteobacteria bacterium]|nr:hypothetical protein [Gammaproteobacteria bacterium]